MYTLQTICPCYYTFPTVPTQPPTNVALLSKNETSFHLVWNPPDPWNRNGPIIGYVVAYHIDTDGEEGELFAVIGGDFSLEFSKNKKTTVSDNQIEITGLRPQTSYAVSVAAKTEVGEGPYSASLIVTTSQSGKVSVCVCVHLCMVQPHMCFDDTLNLRVWLEITLNMLGALLLAIHPGRHTP